MKGAAMTTVAYHVDDPNIAFVRNDIVRFAAVHERVILFVVKLPDPGLPANVVVVDDAFHGQHDRPMRSLLRNLPAAMGIYLRECVDTRRLLPLRPALRKLANNFFKADAVMQSLKSLDAADAWHYSFWFYHCIHLALLRARKRIPKAVARAHGGDVYEERGSLRGVIFRHFTLRHLDAVYSVSGAGADYLRIRYPQAAHKVHVSYLGCEAAKDLPQFPAAEPLVVVSCAKIRNVKRIHRIGAALCHLKMPVRWVHIGDENLGSMDPAVTQYVLATQRLILNPNVEVVRTGPLDHDAVMAFYRSEAVHLFISLSEAEGIPVSIMEAMAHGIPTLATDVGGCGEIVTEHTGLLVPVDMPVEEVAAHITTFAQGPMNTPAFRQGVHAFWSEHFDIDRNYARFFAGIHGH